MERALGALDGAALPYSEFRERRRPTSDPSTLHRDFDEVRDITVIGAGPVGLATAFWAGMREASSRMIDSLPELGGQLTTLYPEKWIFDVPGHPRVLAKDLVEMLREQALDQFDVPVHLETTAERDLVGEGGPRRRPAHRPGRPALADRDRGRRPRGVRAQEAARLRHDPWEGRGAHYLVGDKAEFAGQGGLIVGGGDSACDWVINLLDIAERDRLVHRREGFRAHEVTVGQVMEAAEPATSMSHVPFQIKEVRATGRSSASGCSTPRTRRTRSSSRSTRSSCSSGSRPRSGPLKDWGFEVVKGAIVVDR